MKLQVMMLAGLAASAVACSASHPGTAPASTVTVTASTSKAGSMDDAYMRVLSDAGIHIERAEAIQLGHKVCDWFKLDHDNQDLAAVSSARAIADHYTDMSQKQAGELMGAARAAYCPEVNEADAARDAKFTKQLSTLGISVSEQRASEIASFVCDELMQQGKHLDGDIVEARMRVKYPEVSDPANATIVYGWATVDYCPKFSPYN